MGHLKAFTDYPFIFLGDISFKEAPIREIEVISYDGNKYCDIIVAGIPTSIKRWYIYTESGHLGEVPTIDVSELPEKPCQY